MSDTFPPPDPATLAGPGSASRDESITAAFAVSIGITALIGAACGLAWGGIGGRIAMRIVFLTSNENVRGLTSDDGFEIGTISGATVVLLILTTILGGIAALVAGVLRMVTAGPTWIVAHVVPFTTHRYVNADLTLDLHRYPTGEWISLDATTNARRDRHGTAHGVLSDRTHPIGHTLQSLVIDAR